MYSHDLNVHCEICAYSRFCETKELKGENNSVLHSLFSLPPSTYWWASSCILGNQWLKRFHRVSAWLRVIWQIYELCWTRSKCPENNRHSARWMTDTIITKNYCDNYYHRCIRSLQLMFWVIQMWIWPLKWCLSSIFFIKVQWTVSVNVNC